MPPNPAVGLCRACSREPDTSRLPLRVWIRNTTGWRGCHQSQSWPFQDKNTPLLFCVELLDNFCRNTANKAFAGEGPDYDRTRRNRNVVAQRHASENYSSCTYPTVFAYMSELLLKHLGTSLSLFIRQKIIALHPLRRNGLHLMKNLVMAVIKLSCHTFFKFSHIL